METKYGKSDLDQRVFCKTCCCAVPVYKRLIIDRFRKVEEYWCLKCKHYGNETLIKRHEFLHPPKYDG